MNTGGGCSEIWASAEQSLTFPSSLDPSSLPNTERTNASPNKQSVVVPGMLATAPRDD